MHRLCVASEKRNQVEPAVKAAGVQAALDSLLDDFLRLVEAVQPDQREREIRKRKGIIGVQSQRRAVSLCRLLVLPGDHERVPVYMVSIYVLRVGLGQQRSHFDALVEFAGNISEKGRRDFESLTLTHPVAQLV